MPGVFDTIIAQGISERKIPARTQEAREWYRDAAKNHGSSTRKGGKEAGRKDYAKISEKKLLAEAEPSRLVASIKPGQMYMFSYDPKWKDELPYYDRFPLIFPFNVQEDRFWGINMHYLPLNQRAQLMNALYGIRTNSRYDDSTKLKISWQILKQAAGMKFISPCVKQYLFSHKRSQFLYIRPTEWDIALFLPVEKFTKATKSQVWADTKKKQGIRRS